MHTSEHAVDLFGAKEADWETGGDETETSFE